MKEILPQSYTTPLYFTSEELQLLKGSPAQSKHLRNNITVINIMKCIFWSHNNYIIAVDCVMGLDN